MKEIIEIIKNRIKTSAVGESYFVQVANAGSNPARAFSDCSFVIKLTIEPDVVEKKFFEESDDEGAISSIRKLVVESKTTQSDL